MLSRKEVHERIMATAIPVVVDNHWQVKENPRNPELYDEVDDWGAGIVWVVSADKKYRRTLNYVRAGTVKAFLRMYDEACKALKEEIERSRKRSKAIPGKGNPDST